MGGIDFSSFYKFLSSLGLLIVIGSLAFPMGILSLPDASSVCVEDVCLARTNMQLFLYQYWWVITSLGLILGIALMGYGMGKWNERQKGVDVKEDAEIAKITASPMSPFEMEEKSLREAKELDTPVSPHEGPVAVKADVSRAEIEVERRRIPSERALLSQHLEIESMVASAFQKVMGERGRLVQPNTRLVIDGTLVAEVDALAVPLSRQGQPYILEVKYVPGSTLAKNLGNILERAKALAYTAARFTGNESSAVPVMVIIHRGEVGSYDQISERF